MAQATYGARNVPWPPLRAAGRASPGPGGGDQPRLRAINLGNPGGPLDTERAVVTWEGPGEPIVLTLYGPDGEVGFAPTGKVPLYHGSDPRQNI